VHFLNLCATLCTNVQINSLDIQRNGQHIVTGGQDKFVKLWRYDEGDHVAIGTGHSGAITRVRISPDEKIIVSVGAEGAIFIWEMP
jgi:WD40 repeat protein